jgi:hypothetical protein
MIDIDRPYLEPLIHLRDSPVKFTKGYNASLKAHHALGERHNDCRFAFGKRLHGWLPFLSFNIPSAFIGIPNRRSFPRHYFGNDDFLCDVPRNKDISITELEIMSEMMISKLKFFIDNEERLIEKISQRREVLWKRLKRQADNFTSVIIDNSKPDSSIYNV